MNKPYLYSKDIKVSTNWGTVLFLAVWLSISLIILTFVGYGIIFYNDRVGDLLFPWLFFFVMALVALNTLIWNLKGKEIIIVTSSGLILRKTGKLISSVNKIGFHELERIDYDNDTETLSRKFWKISGGKIIIKYLGTERRIGQNLDLKTAEQITHDIYNAINSVERQSLSTGASR